MTGGYVFHICSCGMSILIPADVSSFYCWNCRRQWPRNPRAGRPVQYGSRRPKRVYRAWPERGPYYPRPQPVRIAPLTPPTKIMPANFRMIDPPVGPIPGAEPPVVPATAAAPVKAATNTAGMIFWAAFTIIMLVIAVSIITNPRGFLDKIEGILSSSGSSSSGSTTSCAEVNRMFSSIGSCSSSNGYTTKSGYSWCDVTLRQKSGCSTSGGVTLCDSGYGQGWVPNRCIP